jgi:argininosuccinate lyase
MKKEQLEIDVLKLSELAESSPGLDLEPDKAEPEASGPGQVGTLSAKAPASKEDVGRLSRPPNPVLFRLLYETQAEHDLVEVLPHLLLIDAAHVVMLVHAQLLSPEVGAELLRVNREVERLMKLGKQALVTNSRHRGFYFLYEQEYIKRLGKQVGGAAHLARSRNDINATVTRSRVREQLLAMLIEFCRMAYTICNAGQKYSDAVMCGFTHMQPAQPSTLGHYLAAMLSELLRSAELMDSSYDTINACPMGAAAGLGTSFAINRGEVAELLGFDSIVQNSADAVASRDYLVHLLSGMAMMGISFTRFATDLQIWSSAAYGFVDWDDDLVSTSSIMPQKRNAFVWENIRGKAVTPLGSLVSTLTGMKNVSFNNTVEVSAEASAHVWPALKASVQAMQLVQLLIQNLRIHPNKMHAFLQDKQTTMTAMADLLVARYGLAFRTAHDAVSRLVNLYPELPAPNELKTILERIIIELAHIRVHLDPAELAMALDPLSTALNAHYGGGPACEAVRSQIRSLARRTSAIENRAKRRQQQLRHAEEELRNAAAALVARK